MIFFISGYIRYSTKWSVKKKGTEANIIMLGRIEAHICICFTAYTIMLELERELKAAKSDITLYKAGRLTKTMYQLNYKMPNSHRTKSVILQMDSKQKELYDIVLKNGLKKITHLGRDRTIWS